MKNAYVLYLQSPLCNEFLRLYGMAVLGFRIDSEERLIYNFCEFDRVCAVLLAKISTCG